MRKMNIRIAGEHVEEGKRCYSELIKIKSYSDRFKYLQMNASIGYETFGFERYLNQTFYKSDEWKEIRRQVIIRDEGCDLADQFHPIHNKIIIHHMNPITEQDILNRNPIILNPEYLICVSLRTHNAIHFGDESYIRDREIVERRPNDTCPWKN